MRETWDDVGGVRKAGTIPRRVVLSCESEGASDKAFGNNITFLNGRPCNRANKTNRYKGRLTLLRAIHHSMPRPFPLLTILLLGAALALTIPFLVPSSTDNLPPNALKRFFSRARPRLVEVVQPKTQPRINPLNTGNMTRTPVYFISHGK